MTNPRRPGIGSRVVLRYRREPRAVPSQSDALGTLIAVDPAVVVRSADGTEVSVDPAQVVVLKSVPPRPVRTSAVRNLEHAIATADAEAETAWVEGWFARAIGSAGADGSSAADALRLDAAAPLADPSMPEWDFFHDLFGVDTLRALAQWFAQHDLPLTLRLPDRLVRPPTSWTTFGLHSVLTARLPLADRDRGEVHGGDSDRSPAITATGPRSAQIRSAQDGRPAVDVRLSTAPDERVWAVLTTVSGEADQGAETPGGIADALTLACEWAHGQGASEACLAVRDEDEALDRTARGTGFTDHHRCRYVRLAATMQQ